MKKLLNLGALGVVFTLALFLIGCQNQNEEKMRHIVILKYKPTATDEQIARVTDSLRDLKNKIPGVLDFEHGVNNSPENLNKDFTHVHLFTFKDAEARDRYLPHPEHQNFVKMLEEMAIVEDVFVVDYSPAK